MEKRGMKNFLFRMLCGFFLGVSVIAPGVSSSVMAVIMGFYRDLIEIISNPFKNFKKNVLYILPMGIGALLSVLLLIQGFSYLSEHIPFQFTLLFVGLVAGGLQQVFKEAGGKPHPRDYIAIFAAFLFAAAVGFLGRGLTGDSVNTAMWYLCIAGLVAGVSSMVPGMSVSLVLMLFGVYNFLLNTAAGVFDNPLHVASIAIPVGVCFVIGMIAFSNVTKRAFDRYKRFAYYLVFGFICGTLVAVFPTEWPDTAGGWLGGAAALVIGLCIAVAFQWIGKKLNVEDVKAGSTATLESDVVELSGDEDIDATQE